MCVRACVRAYMRECVWCACVRVCESARACVCVCVHSTDFASIQVDINSILGDISNC